MPLEELILRLNNLLHEHGNVRVFYADDQEDFRVPEPEALVFSVRDIKFGDMHESCDPDNTYIRL